MSANKNTKPSVEFTAFGRVTEDGETSDVLVGANLGAAELAASIERTHRWEKLGTSRKWTAVAGSAVFEVQTFSDALASLDGQVFSSLAEVKAAVRAALAVRS